MPDFSIFFSQLHVIFGVTVYQIFTGCKPIYCAVNAAIDDPIFQSVLERQCAK